NAPSPTRPSLSCAISTSATLERLVDQEDVREQRAEVDRSVEIVDELRADRFLRQDQPERGSRLAGVVIEHREKGRKGLRRGLSLGVGSGYGGEPVERGSSTPKIFAHRTAALVLAPLRSIGKHELVSLLDGVDPLGQRRFAVLRHYPPFGRARSPSGNGHRAAS